MPFKMGFAQSETASAGIWTRVTFPFPMTLTAPQKKKYNWKQTYLFGSNQMTNFFSYDAEKITIAVEFDSQSSLIFLALC